MTDTPRQAGTILFYVEPPEDQQRAQRFEIVQGMLQADNGWIYAWKLGHSYRDFTTMDKLQPGCRVSFEITPGQPYLATGLSFRNAARRETPSSADAVDPSEVSNTGTPTPREK